MDKRIAGGWSAFVLMGFFAIMFCVITGILVKQLDEQAHAKQLDVLHREAVTAQQQAKTLQERVEKAEAKVQALDKQVKDLNKQNADQRKTLQHVLSSEPLSSRAGGSPISSVAFGPWRSFTATWYSPQGGVGDGLRTATGAPVTSNTIAVDPAVIPLGSVVEIKFPDGHIDIKRATDTGGAIHGNRVDIFDWSESTCVRNGVQAVQIRVIGKK